MLFCIFCYTVQQCIVAACYFLAQYKGHLSECETVAHQKKISEEESC